MNGQIFQDKNGEIKIGEIKKYEKRSKKEFIDIDNVNNLPLREK